MLLQGHDGDSVACHAFLKELSRHLRGYFRRRLTGLLYEVEDLVEASDARRDVGELLDRMPLVLVVPVLAMWLLAAFVLIDAEPAQRVDLVFGDT